MWDKNHSVCFALHDSEGAARLELTVGDGGRARIVIRDGGGHIRAVLDVTEGGRPALVLGDRNEWARRAGYSLPPLRHLRSTPSGTIEVKRRLKVHPEFCRCFERFSQIQSGFSSDAALPFDQLIQSRTGPTQSLSKRGLRQTHGL